ncbi:hypothetical protein ADUPG1_002511, partial [Aduncisulcus paluster]
TTLHSPPHSGHSSRPWLLLKKPDVPLTSVTTLSLPPPSLYTFIIFDVIYSNT